MFAAYLRDPVRQGDRYPDHPVVVLEALVQILSDPPLRVRGKAEPPGRVEPLHRADESHCGLLDQVFLGKGGLSAVPASVLHGLEVTVDDVIYHAEVHLHCETDFIVQTIR